MAMSSAGDRCAQQCGPFQRRLCAFVYMCACAETTQTGWLSKSISRRNRRGLQRAVEKRDSYVTNLQMNCEGGHNPVHDPKARGTQWISVNVMNGSHSQTTMLRTIMRAVHYATANLRRNVIALQQTHTLERMTIFDMSDTSNAMDHQTVRIIEFFVGVICGFRQIWAPVSYAFNIYLKEKCFFLGLLRATLRLFIVFRSVAMRCVALYCGL